MKAFVITLKNNSYSERVADRCINSAAKFGISVEKYYGVDKTNAYPMMESFGLTWTWANNNTSNRICPITKLRQFPYVAADLRAKIGCAMSHYLLWKKCIELDEPILILEHDAVFINPLPDIQFNGICQINDPQGATPKGKYWHDVMVQRNKAGVFPKTRIRTGKDEMIPDGLAGNSAYMIKPWAAQELIQFVDKVGLWHNDCIINIQNQPWLEEIFPFVTVAKQTHSTSTT